MNYLIKVHCTAEIGYNEYVLVVGQFRWVHVLIFLLIVHHGRLYVFPGLFWDQEGGHVVHSHITCAHIFRSHCRILHQSCSCYLPKKGFSGGRYLWQGRASLCRRHDLKLQIERFGADAEPGSEGGSVSQERLIVTFKVQWRD